MTFEEYKEKYNIKLTEQQSQAVLKTDGYTLLLAVPGSGKTTVIVSRLGYMINCLGISYENILTLTYSVASCADMKSRYVSVFGNVNVPQFRTIHGVCALIIREYERRSGNKAFELLDKESECKRIIYDIYSETVGKNPLTGDINNLQRQITYARNMMYTAEQARESVFDNDGFFEVYKKYREVKKAAGVMDYDDQLEYALKILKKYPEILKTFKSKYRYINVDEAQDTSKIQHEIIRVLTEKNLFMVGDEDQSIYGFRAAYPQALLNFEKTYPNACVLLMEQNFRTTGKILERASDFIAHNVERYKKNMYTQKGGGEDIRIINVPKYEDGLKLVCEICKKAQNNEKENTAILFRNNESAIPIIDVLQRNGISYKCKETDGAFFENPIVADVLLMMKFCLNTQDYEIFKEIAPRLGCGLSKESSETIALNAEKLGIAPLEFLKIQYAEGSEKYSKICVLANETEVAIKRTPYRALLNILTKTCFGVFQTYRLKEKSKFSVLLSVALKCQDIEEFLQRMQELQYFLKTSFPSPNSCAVLSTVHSSKGLEYDNVVIIDVRDGIFPGGCPGETDKRQELELLEEERRLFYVAVTRAKKNVKIIKYNIEYDNSYAADSVFIKELMNYDENDVKSLKTKFKNGNIKKASTDKTDISAFKKGAEVIHGSYGVGVITELYEEKCTVDFFNGKTAAFNLKTSVSFGIIKLKNVVGTSTEPNKK